jgi:outer membrane lipoprotein LolB
MRCDSLFPGAWLAVLLAAACAELPSTGSLEDAHAQSWEARRAALDRVRRWSLYGRIAIQTEQEGWTAGLRWFQREDSYYLRVMAPFGQGTYELERHPRAVVMRTANNKVLTADDPETLMRENLGWSIPVEGLHYWLRGIPDPRSPIATLSLDNKGRMTDMEQAGWRIQVRSYMHTGDLLELPAMLFLYAPRVQVRLAVQRWEIH